ncbi:MAG TPA: DUF5050 domain-containing protein [Negativicutes bacterium]|nr:DUF5050 domain-containing protein [Negativicutes bacterium]
MKRIKYVLLSCLLGSVGWFGTSCAAAPLGLYSVPEIKIFTLQERTVVAVALEDRVSGKDIENVLGYRLMPVFDEKRSKDQLEITLSNVMPTWTELPVGIPLVIETVGAGQIRFSLKAQEAAQTNVFTVWRKTIKARDGMIRMRTYLVFNIPKGIKKDIPTIVLDPGHGGEDTGAVKNFIEEKDINLDISLRTARLFATNGWNVVLTRSTDVEPSLLERADTANILNATVFVSIHNNSLPDEKIPRSREFGTTVLYNSSALNPAFDLARIMQDELVGSLGTQREVLQDRPKLVVLNSTWVPSVLTEGIMMPNPANAKMILDRIQRQRTAEAIVRAVETWRGRKVLAAKKAQPTGLLPLVKLTLLPPGGGNVAGNTANRGIVAEKDGWIYYLKKAGSLAGEREDTLWRFRPDRFLSDELVADQEVWDLNVSENALYYSNWSEGHSIYRASLNGANPTRLTDGPAEQISLAGDQLVFVRNRQIYTMPIVGGTSLLVTADVAENAVVWGNWIYYANGSDGFKPYKVKLDGTGRVKIVNDETLFMSVTGDWLFYSNLSDGEKLYRVKTDGSQRGKVSDDRAGYLNADQRFVYYTNISQGNALFRIKPDGGERMKLMDGEAAAGPIGIASGKLYYRGLFQDLK